MKEKTLKQIENLKNQTIGVEVEMNCITRKDAARMPQELPQSFSEPTGLKIPPTATATARSAHGMLRDANGSFRRT